MIGRSGSYKDQPGGYQAFIPSPLPPDPPLVMDPALENLLSRADRSIGRLDGIGRMLPDPDLFVAMYLRKEGVLSSQIEGSQATFPDLLEYESGTPVRELPEDIGEVANYIAATKAGLEKSRGVPVSISLIKELHSLLLKDSRGSELTPGSFRDSQNWIGSPGCPIHLATFVPPPPREVEPAMRDLEEFVVRETEMPPLIICGLVHNQFETIHPFRDGNGRVGRLLVTLLLCQKDVLIRPLLYLSHYFLQNRGDYYDSLMRVRTAGDWEGWLRFFLSGVDEVSREAVEKTARILELREDHRRRVQEHVRRGKSLELLELLLSRPVISVRTISERLKVAFATAGNLVEDFVRIGILSESGNRKRNRLFVYSSYVDLLSQ